MKLSKYPVGTIIEIKGYDKFDGKYEKVSERRFKSIKLEATYFTTPHLKKMRKQGVKVTVVAIPWNVVSELLMMLKEEYGPRDSNGKVIFFDDILKMSISRVEESKKAREARERVMQDYCRADVELTEKLIDRFSKSAIFTPYTPYTTYKL